MTFPYPGDDPGTLSTVSAYIDGAHTNMSTFGTGLSAITKQLGGAWQSDASTKAQADLGLLTAMMPTIGTDLSSAKRAVDEYASALIPIRSQIDDLRTQYTQQSTILSGQQAEYGRAARFGEANDMTTSEIADYRQTIAGDETKTQSALSELQTSYNRLVTRANAAAQVCSAALKAGSTSQSYDGGSTLTTISLDQALNVGGLAILHQKQMQDLATKYAEELKKANSGDGKEAAIYHQIALEAAQYANDPDFAATFYGDLGSQYTGLIPEILYSIGSKTAGSDLTVFSQLFGTAVSNQSADARMTAVANSFLNTPKVAVTSWDRAAMCSAGTFPSTWLAEAARYNAMDDLAKNGSQGFGGFGYRGEPNGVNFVQQVDLPGDVVAAWGQDLSHNPQASRDVLATMGNGDPTNVTPGTGPAAIAAYTANIHKLISYGASDTYPGDVAKSNGLMFEAASGADDETDGSHSLGATDFTQALFNDLGHGDGDKTQPIASDSYAKIAGSYVQELAAGSNMDGDTSGTNGMTVYAGQNPSFGVPPDLTKELMHTFVGDAGATQTFDNAAGTAAHQAMVAGARADAGSPAATASHFNDVSQAYGSVAGAENKATTDVVGERDESDAASQELVKNILSAGVDLIPGEKLIEAVPGTAWDIAKHMANIGLEHAYGATDDPRFDALQDTSHSIALVSEYDKLEILHEAGYPGTDQIPPALLDPTTHQLLSPDKILNNQDLQQQFHDYLLGPGSVSDGSHVSIYEATENAAGRYQNGFDKENG